MKVSRVSVPRDQCCVSTIARAVSTIPRALCSIMITLSARNCDVKCGIKKLVSWSSDEIAQ